MSQNVTEELRKLRRDARRRRYSVPGKRERKVLVKIRAGATYSYSQLQADYARGRSQRYTLAMALYDSFRNGGGI